MLRFGNITEVDPTKGYARVTFTDDGIVSDWLQFLTLGAIKDNFSYTFNVNEQVACLMDENSEEGVILGALFNDKTPPNNAGDGVFRVKFDDDSVIEYNRNSSEYKIDIKGKINILADSELLIKSTSTVNIEAATANIKGTATANIEAVNANVKATAIAKIEAPVIQLNGAVAVTGAITVTGTITAPGGAAISGNFEVAGQLKGATVMAGSIGLGTHKHTGVQTGAGTSGTPIP